MTYRGAFVAMVMVLALGSSAYFDAQAAEGTRAVVRQDGITSAPATRGAVRRPATSRPTRTSRRRTQQPPAPAATLQPITEEARKAAERATRDWARRMSRACQTDFAELETEHFLIFHNWDAREGRFLEENVEGCYRAIARQFDLPPDATVFAGKPPLFMVAGDEEYAAALKEVSSDLDPKSFVGLALTAPNGLACMIMSKPVKTDYEDVKRTEKRWASVLAHEMTHLFASRWHTDKHLPAWINEGLAELMETRLFPELHTKEGLARYLVASMDVNTLLEMARPETPRDYACMQTIVETLVDTNSREFIHLVAMLKEDATVEDALEACYGWTVDDLQSAWQDHLREVYHIRPRRSRD